MCFPCGPNGLPYGEQHVLPKLHLKWQLRRSKFMNLYKNTGKKVTELRNLVSLQIALTF